VTAFVNDWGKTMSQQESKRRPTSVSLGPLTELLLKDAHWYNLDSFPAVQVWADDVEAVLRFLQAEGRLDVFLKDIKSLQTPQHRDARFAEARGAFHLARNGFRIVQWEPPGEGKTKGEALILLPDSPEVFVEVKQPGWHGELMPRRIAERKALSPETMQRLLARKRQDKYINGEGGAVGPQINAMDVVRRNALPKLTDRTPNLVVVVDDLKVTTVGLPSLSDYVQREFSKPDHDPDDPDDKFTYERLGGILFLQPEANNDEAIDYRADFVENPAVLPSCALPASVIEVLSGLREESRARRAKLYEGQRSIFDILGRNSQRPLPEDAEVSVSAAIDVRKREPVVCPDCGQQLFALMSKEQTGKAVLGDCRCGREIFDVPDGSIMYGPKDAPMFIYGPEQKD
jgi:hypothetical protein